jgi:hypothetical protein
MIAAHARTQHLVKVVLELECMATLHLILRVEGRFAVPLLQLGNDRRRVTDRLSIQKKDWQRPMSRRAPGFEQVVAAGAFAPVRNVLEVQRPAHLLTEMREGDVPQQR